MDSKPEVDSAPVRTVEVRHGQNFDILLNLRIPEQEKVRGLANTVSNGIPSSWQVFEGALSEDKTSEPNIFVDNGASPKFLAKVRKMATPARVRKAREETTGISPELSKQVDYAYDSLLNEFSLSPIVQDILKKKQAHQLAEKYGFTSIQLVEPLVGLIERSTGKKIVFYDFIDADTTFYSRSPDRTNRVVDLREQDQDDKLVVELENIFRKNGIFPADIGPHQLMSVENLPSKQHSLYLVDIEGFFMDPKNKFSRFKAWIF